MAEIPGLSGLEIDERVTRWNPYRWCFRFRTEDFGGVHRDVFRDALIAEGIRCGTGLADLPSGRYLTFSFTCPSHQRMTVPASCQSGL